MPRYGNTVRRVTATFLLILVSSALHSHEFWLLPGKFKCKPGETVQIDFMVGEDFEGEYWDLNRHKVVKLELCNGAQVKNLLGEVKTSAGKNLTVIPDKEGTYLVGLQSDAAFIELEAEKFNAYLEEDGLDDIISTRTREGTLSRGAREFYQRFAKLLIQSGDRTDETYRRRMGYRYEIIPLGNPYTLKAGDYLQCRILWEGQPAPHTLVKVWSKAGRRSFLQNIYTENDGTITFPVSHEGPWMVSAVKMIPSEVTGADYQSFWASLVFSPGDIR